MNTHFDILIFEQDEILASVLQESMQTDYFRTEVVLDTKEAYQRFSIGDFVLCLIDLPECKQAGFTLGEKMKLFNSEVHLIFTCNSPSKEDLVKGFKLGADDFIRKPFIIEEVQARMKAILKRLYPVQRHEVCMYKFGNYTFDAYKQLLSINDKDTKLTTKEFELLRLLCQNAGKLIERNYILQAIWKDDNYFNARSMDVYITKLRKLLKEDPRIAIVNIHGTGYRFEVQK